MIDFTSKDRYGFDDLVQLVRLLRSEDGCPWDRVQTHQSIRRNLLEEAYEVCEGIDRDDPKLLCEELGDVLLQVLFHADIEADAGRFTLDDVCDGICKKLIFRHPHVFGNEVHGDWEEMKRLEKGQKTAGETLDAVAKSLPALWRSEKLLKKAEKFGLSVGTRDAALDKLEKDVRLLRQNADETQIGTVLFDTVRTAVLLEVDPEPALHGRCEAFIDRVSREERASAAEVPEKGELSREDSAALAKGAASERE